MARAIATAAWIAAARLEVIADPLPVDAALGASPAQTELLDRRQRVAREQLLHCVEAEAWAGEEAGEEASAGVERAVFRAAACFAWLVACSSPRGVLAVELYAGHGHLTRALASGLARSTAASCAVGWRDSWPTLLSFEGDPHAIPRVLARLAPHRRTWLKADPPQGLTQRLRGALAENRSDGVTVRECPEQGGEVEAAVLLGSAYPAALCPHACGRAGGKYWQGDDIRDCFKCPAPEPGQSALRELCEGLLGERGRLDLVLLDTASPGIEEWFVLERHCRPRNVLLINGRLPMHQGWVADRLLQAPGSSWREVHAGLTQWSALPWPGMLDLLRFSSFRLLADLAEEPPLSCATPRS